MGGVLRRLSTACRTPPWVPRSRTCFTRDTSPSRSLMKPAFLASFPKLGYSESNQEARGVTLDAALALQCRTSRWSWSAMVPSARHACS
eukprot:7101364-Prymnesium_polylepis.1